MKLQSKFLRYAVAALFHLAVIQLGFAQETPRVQIQQLDVETKNADLPSKQFNSLNRPAKVLILPFNIHSEKDMSFLRDGLSDMLSTRLMIEGELTSISRDETADLLKNFTGSINEIRAINFGKKAAADYVVFGSLTILGDSVSTDTRFIDVSDQKTLVTFFETGQNQGDIISHINLFAERINEQVFGRPSKSSSSKPSVPSPPVDESRKHPELLWNEEGGMLSSSQDKESSGESLQLKSSIWKSRIFNTEIQGITVADTDGDGLNETIFIGGQTIYVYRHKDNKFSQLAEFKEKSYITLLGIDAADINGNGKAEIFVTAVNPNVETNQSFVLEWNGVQYAKIVQRSDWYFRCITIPGQRPILVGQKRSMNDFFTGAIHELGWINNTYESVRDLGLPNWVNVFGFAIGPLDGQDMMTAGFAQNDHIRILNQNGKEEWRSNQPFGGSLLYLESRPASSSKASQYNEIERRYIPLRILMKDMDGDGKADIIVGKNEDTAGKMFEKFRLFKNGNIKCLGWDQIGLFEKWKTRDISGYISDYALADINNDGKDELAISVISKTDSVIGKAASFIIYHQLK